MTAAPGFNEVFDGGTRIDDGVVGSRLSAGLLKPGSIYGFLYSQTCRRPVMSTLFYNGVFKPLTHFSPSIFQNEDGLTSL